MKDEVATLMEGEEEEEEEAEQDSKDADLELPKLAELENAPFNIEDLNRTIDEQDDDIVLTGEQELPDLGLSHEVDLDEGDEDVVRQTLEEMVSKATDMGEEARQSDAVSAALKSIPLLQPIPPPQKKTSDPAPEPAEPLDKIPWVGYLIEKVLRQSAHGSLTLEGVHENIINLDPVYA